MNAVSPEYGEVHLPVHDGSQLGPVQLAQLQLLVTVVLLQTAKIFYNVAKIFCGEKNILLNGKIYPNA